MWGDRNVDRGATVDAEIVRLRRAIGGRKREAPIRTVRSLGYVFEVRRRRAACKSTTRQRGDREPGRRIGIMLVSGIVALIWIAYAGMRRPQIFSSRRCDQCGMAMLG